MEGGGSGARRAKQSYLDKLGEDELRNILRHLSVRPRYVGWRKEVSPYDLLCIVNNGGPLAAVARTEFTGLSTLDGDFNHTLCVNVSSSFGKAVFKHLLSELGPALEVLIIHTYHEALIKNSPVLTKHCTSLSYLRVSCTGKDLDISGIIAANSGNLRFLGINGKTLGRSTVQAIAEHCMGLQTLQIEYQRTMGVLLPVWQTVGPSVEDLSLDMSMLTVKKGVRLAERMRLVDEIGDYCVKVSTFGFSNSDFDSVVRLCEKFGPRLKYLKFRAATQIPSHSQMTKILDACPKLRVDAFYGLHGSTSLTIFRDRLRACQFHDCVLDMQGNTEEVGNSIPSLEELNLSVFKSSNFVRFVSDFFSLPKPGLKSLHLDTIISRDVPEENSLDIIAGYVRGLEQLSVSVVGFRTGIFRDIAGANKRLKRVSVWCKLFLGDHNPEYAEDAAVSFEEDFSQCPLLQELVLDNVALQKKSIRIAEACVLFRGRGVDIFIGGTQYL